LKKRTLIAIIAILALAIFILLTLSMSSVLSSSGNLYLVIFLGFLLAITAGLLIKIIPNKFSPKSKVSQTTVIMKPKRLLAKLVFSNDMELIIKEYEKTFGREDFLGVALADNLLFIGKEHFKISRMDDGYYIEDLETKNGTILNGEDITGLGKQKLVNGDEILVAKTLDIRYLEENI